MKLKPNTLYVKNLEKITTKDWGGRNHFDQIIEAFSKVGLPDGEYEIEIQGLTDKKVFFAGRFKFKKKGK